MLRLLGRQLARPAALAAGAVGTACASGYAYHQRSSCEQSAPSQKKMSHRSLSLSFSLLVFRMM